MTITGLFYGCSSMLNALHFDKPQQCLLTVRQSGDTEIEAHSPYRWLYLIG